MGITCFDPSSNQESKLILYKRKYLCLYVTFSQVNGWTNIDEFWYRYKCDLNISHKLPLCRKIKIKVT